ncbi:sugar ABC transporter permease [Candidatus Bathyarchaeota archaeon]|nr:MAG: sugar ABC transporter permease [Candidatus Bathyarchaeota archaeon]
MVMRNTFGLAFLELALRILVALPIALLFNEARKYGETFCALLLLPGTISGVVISFIIQWIFNPAYGLANWYLMTFGILSEPLEITKNMFTAWTALILASIWGGYPSTVIILFAALRAIPEDLYESAKVDGAGAFNRFLHVTLPWLKPALRYLIILGTIFGLRGFFIFSYIITKGGPAGQTDVYGTYLFRTLLNNYQFGYASALSVFMLILNFVMIALYLKFFKARIY